MPEFLLVLLIMLLASLAAIYVIGGEEAINSIVDVITRFLGG